MASGDAAANAGLAILDGTAKVREFYIHVNDTRDMLANHETTGIHSQSQITNLPTDLATLAAAAASAASLGTQARGGDMDIAVWNRDVGSFTRKAVWMGNTGQILLGFASSLRRHKEDHGPVGWTAEQLRQIPIVYYKYLTALAREADGGQPAALEIGSYADDLHKAGLWEFVMYEGHGRKAKPVGIHYELLGLAALKLGQLAFDQIDELAARLDRVEKAILNGESDARSN